MTLGDWLAVGWLVNWVILWMFVRSYIWCRRRQDELDDERRWLDSHWHTVMANAQQDPKYLEVEELVVANGNKEKYLVDHYTFRRAEQTRKEFKKNWWKFWQDIPPTKPCYEYYKDFM